MVLTSHAQTVKLGDLNHDNEVGISDVMMLVDIVINGYKSFFVEPTMVTMSPGGTNQVEIFGGYNSYAVSSSNTSIVEATLNGTTITLTARNGGETTVIVNDVQTSRSIEIAVKVNARPLEISPSALSLVVGDEDTAEIYTGSGSFSVESSDENVAVADLEGRTITITAIDAGTATITVTDTQSGEKGTIEVTVKAALLPELSCPDGNHPHMIDLGLTSGTKWACCNVDTDHPERQSPTNYGGYYAWGETETKTIYSWNTYIHCDGSYDTCIDLGPSISGTQYDVAHVKWGGAWQMPTNEQHKELFDHCTYIWTTMNGVDGYKFTGPNGSSIFLPAAGLRHGSFYDDASAYGENWSGTSNEDDSNYGGILYFNSASVETDYGYRCYGRPVRPVAK